MGPLDRVEEQIPFTDSMIAYSLQAMESFKGPRLCFPVTALTW